MNRVLRSVSFLKGLTCGVLAIFLVGAYYAYKDVTSERDQLRKTLEQTNNKFYHPRSDNKWHNKNRKA